jgi:hypothetical protein
MKKIQTGLPRLNAMLKNSSERIWLKTTARSLRARASSRHHVATLGLLPCLLSTNSVDTRGRAQTTKREGKVKHSFRPWHITWMAEHGKAPEDKQYSHRCHNENCVQPSHGRWETDQENKSRNACKSCSHVVLPDTKCILLCPHKPCCLTPRLVPTWDDKSFVNTPLQ